MNIPLRPPPLVVQMMGLDTCMSLVFDGSGACKLFVGTCWHILHLCVSVILHGLQLVRIMMYYLAPSGLLGEYRDLKLDKLMYLAIVFDNGDSKDLMMIVKLLKWLSDVGLSNFILYDVEGNLKRSEGTLKNLIHDSSGNITDGKTRDSTLCVNRMETPLELLSWADGKEGIAKAASFLYKNNSRCARREDFSGISVSEKDMEDALTAVGIGGTEPDLLLVFGPVRCHLGFPAWRIRYTEIVHMGPLSSLKHGALVQALYDFSVKKQNYGS